MVFKNIEIVKNEKFSTVDEELYIIRFKYVFNGEDDETVLEYVKREDVHLAIAAIMQDPVNFREMYP